MRSLTQTPRKYSFLFYTAHLVPSWNSFHNVKHIALFSNDLSLHKHMHTDLLEELWLHLGQHVLQSS